jgi:hypothetical protein
MFGCATLSKHNLGIYILQARSVCTAADKMNKRRNLTMKTIIVD